MANLAPLKADDASSTIKRNRIIALVVLAILLIGEFYFLRDSAFEIFIAIMMTIVIVMAGINILIKKKQDNLFTAYCYSNVGYLEEMDFIRQPAQNLKISAFTIDTKNNRSYYVHTGRNVHMLNINDFCHEQLNNFIPEKIFWYNANFVNSTLKREKKNNILFGLALDYTNKNIFIIDMKNEGKLIKFKDVLNIKIIEHDGRSTKTITDTSIKTDAGSLVTRTVVGAVLLGGAGAVIGGLSANKTSRSESKTIVVGKVSYEFLIISNSLGTSGYSIFFNNKSDAISLENIFDQILNDNSVEKLNQLQTETIEYQKTKRVDSLNGKSFADELLKLSQLKNGGDITDDEFKQLKKQLINNNS